MIGPLRGGGWGCETEVVCGRRKETSRTGTRPEEKVGLWGPRTQDVDPGPGSQGTGKGWTGQIDLQEGPRPQHSVGDGTPRRNGRGSERTSGHNRREPVLVLSLDLFGMKDGASLLTDVEEDR